ncbi:MAG: hypothetical protein ACR2LZ_00615 [Pyrinomonadaceae bacterium]
MKVILAMLLIVLPVAAQERNRLHQRYKSPERDVYVVRPRIVMSVKFANEPLWKDYACEAVIKPEHTVTSNIGDRETMPSELVLEVIDEVTPVAQRGRLINEMNVNGGCTGILISNYGQVSIVRVTRCKQAGGGTYQASIRWKPSWCEDKKR